MQRSSPLGLGRPLFAALLVLAVFSCSGGGCSGCEGCGIYPIPGGFPIEHRIPNSAQVRLTESGIQFIEDNIDAILSIFLDGGLDFPIPRTSGSMSGVDYTLCPENDCTAHVEIPDFDLTPTPPNRLAAHIRAVLDSRGPGGARRAIPVLLEADVGPVTLRTTCQADIDTRRGSRPYVGLVADVDFVNETRPARAGYTKLVVSGVRLAPGEDVENDDIDIGDCSGVAGWVINALIGIFKTTIINQLQGQVSGLVQSAIEEQLCTRRGMYGCPTGTFDRGNTAEDAICYYEPAGGSDECVPILLGMDGRGDLGAQALGAFSPGTHAPIQLVLASGGDGEAVNGGMSLFMVGGFMSMDRTFTTSPGHNPCVPLVEPPPLPDVPRVAAFRGNVIPGTSTPAHVGIGIAEDYLNYAGYGMFDSGMLCIGAGTRLSQQLSTGLVSGAAMSLRHLAFPQSNAPLTMAIRPQTPPRFTIGTDAGAPLLSIFLDDLMIDFYVWSTERYVRFMTYQTDLTVRIDLDVEAGQVVPRIEGVEAANSIVTNSELLTDNPDTIANVLETVISSFAGMLAGSINPIALPEIMGFELDVPPGGIRGVADGGEAFLGLFANLRLATAPLVAGVETHVEVSDVTLDRESMTLEHWGQGEGNGAWLHFRAEGVPGAEYEYSYRIDHMTWSRWTTEPRVRIDDDILLLQARHVIEARARVRGQNRSIDATPARAELIIDIGPPEVTLERRGLDFVAHASDLISPDDALRYRFRVRDGEWSAWQQNPVFRPETLLLDGGTVGVEVVDEAGNVASAEARIIRGVPNPAGGGCNCGIADGNPDRNGPLALLGSLAVLGATLARRRRRVGARRGAVLTAIAVAAVVPVLAGCDCGGNVPVGMRRDAGPAMACRGECIPASPPETAGSICCEATNLCVDYDLDDLCDPGFTCPPEEVRLDDSCAVSCGACQEKPPLSPGLLATDLDFVVTGDGRMFVSGYSPGVPPNTRYGDLVFGEITDGGVSWEIVDGAPSMPITNGPSGWRGGVSAPGDDVGRWTALAESGGTFYIAYYDATHGALKIAIGSPGAWSIHTVDDTGDAGRYPSIVLRSGVPTIAYLRIDPSTGGSGRPRSSVRVATAASTRPTAGTDWTVAEVAAADMPCRPQFCAEGQSCLENGACVSPTTDCPAACADGEVCSAGRCEAALPASYVEDLPPAYGLYISLASTSSGLALVWYDRAGGNLWGAAQSGGSWGAPFLIDGYARGDAGTGDSGIGASLFVDAAGTWHVTYVDGAEEVLRYAQVVGGTVTVREVVDDGASDGMARHADGRHIVGDDASVAVTDGGEVRVAYQDATSQHMMLARRAAGATGTWTVSILDMENHTGFWVEQVLVGSTSYVATWWRQPSRTDPRNGVRVLTVD